jgi:hypothetical protein
MTRTLSLTTLLLLAACSFAPLSFNVDLLERFPNETSGSFTLTAPAARVDLTPYLGAFAQGSFDVPVPLAGVSVPISGLVLPSATGQLLDFRDRTLPVSLKAATLSYDLNLLRSGGVTGTLEIQPYLAPARETDVARAGYALGEPQLYDLGEASANLRAEVPLNAAQLEAINAGQLRLALGISGTVRLDASGEASFGYSFQSLSLTVSSVAAQLDTFLPDADGEQLDFRDEEVPGPGRIIDLALEHAVLLTHGGDLEGTLSAQVYVAPVGDEPLWQEKFAFGEPEMIDLSQREVVLSGRANLNEAQKPLLGEQRLRIGVRVTGDAALVLEQVITVDYRFQKLLLEAKYAL